MPHVAGKLYFWVFLGLQVLPNMWYSICILLGGEDVGSGEEQFYNLEGVTYLGSDCGVESAINEDGSGTGT